MKRGILLVTCMAILAPVHVLAQTPSTYSVTKEYTGPGVLTMGFCSVTAFLIGEDSELGGACFPLVGDELTVDITIDDDLTEHTGGYHYFLPVQGGNAFFCGSARGVEIPAGATHLVVAVDGAFANAAFCGSLPTTGRITADFHIPPV